MIGATGAARVFIATRPVDFRNYVERRIMLKRKLRCALSWPHLRRGQRHGRPPLGDQREPSPGRVVGA